MKGISLRAAVQADAAFAYAVEEDAMRHYAEQTWGKWNPAADPGAHIASFVASAHQIIELSNRAVGILSVEHHSDHVFLAKVYILSTYRDSGIGSEVLASILSEARSSKKAVRLHTLAVNTRAQAFYERHGFTAESRTHERVNMVYAHVA
jgi:ribosomal protein S18 acetylase RimI-like enzyme